MSKTKAKGEVGKAAQAVSVISGAVFSAVVISALFKRNPKLKDQVEQRLQTIRRTVGSLVNQYVDASGKAKEIESFLKSVNKNSNIEDGRNIRGGKNSFNEAYDSQWENII
jgi:uncharacterized protein (DUF3084 family)